MRYVFVDGAFGAGTYALGVEAFLAAGSACTPGEPGFICESGFTCRVNSCVVAQCNDTTDNDTDTLNNDPGCTSPSDDSETDTRPNGVDCPACANNIDDDLDTLIDFDGADPGCQSASDNLELDECIPGVTVIELPDTGASGTTPASAAGSNFKPSCHSSTMRCPAWSTRSGPVLLRSLGVLSMSRVYKGCIGASLHGQGCALRLFFITLPRR